MTEKSDGNEVQLPPYVIEGARSARARCKTCRRKIDKGVLRIGMLVEGPYGPGHMWHHLKCAARRHLDRVEEAYAMEAWKAAKQPPEKVPDLEQLRTLKEEATQRKRVQKQIPYVEPAPSGRARCKHCEELIEQGSLRVVLGREVLFGNQTRIGPINIHPRCVAAALNADDCDTKVEQFPEQLRANSTDLSEEKIAAVLAEIGDVG